MTGGEQRANHSAQSARPAGETQTHPRILPHRVILRKFFRIRQHSHCPIVFFATEAPESARAVATFHSFILFISKKNPRLNSLYSTQYDTYLTTNTYTHMSTAEYTKTRGSVYQTNGKPLSKEALYKAKLKYGVYQSPSAQSVGVPNSNSASDTAALLASSTDLKIEPYKRSVAADAQTAALFAKKDTAPQRWTRDHIDGGATSAAAAVGSLNKTAETNETHSIASSSRDGASSAASAVLGKSGKSIGSLASSNLASLYEFDAVRSGQKKTCNLDLSLINKASQDRANSMISKRMNPDKNVARSGLATQPKLDDAALETFAAVGALASQNYKPPVDKNLEERAVYKNSLIDPKVLAQASLNAANTLKSIDKYNGSKDLLANADFNRIAMEIASRHQEARSHTSGKVDLGGGLYMTQEELDAIAMKHVSPVLDQINKTADSQRAKDAVVAQEKEERRLAHEQYKADIKAKKMEEQRLKAEAKATRRREMEEEKQRAKDAKLALEKSKKEELEKHKEILSSKQQEEIRKRDELLAKKQAEEERIAQESTEAEKRRTEELTAVERERDTRLAPIIASLKVEQDKLDVLNEEKQAVQDITDTHFKTTENAKSLLVVSQTELTHAQENLEKLKSEIETTTGEQEKLAKEAEIKAAEAEVALKESAELDAEASLKKAEIEKQRALVENERLRLELELENEKIGALTDEKEIAETLPPSEEAKAEDAKTKQQTVITASGPVNTGYKSMVDDALDYKPPAEEKESKDGGELKQTFSGFSQGSGEGKEEDEDKHKSIFKEEF